MMPDMNTISFYKKKAFKLDGAKRVMLLINMKTVTKFNQLTKGLFEDNNAIPTRMSKHKNRTPRTCVRLV